MIRDRVVPVVLSLLIIILVAVVQERSRYLAAVLATMPVTAPLAIWIVFSASQGDHRQTAEFIGSMAIGFAATLVFILACWFGFRQHWGFATTLLFASVIWVTIVSLPRWFGAWPR